MIKEIKDQKQFNCHVYMFTHKFTQEKN